MDSTTTPPMTASMLSSDDDKDETLHQHQRLKTYYNVDGCDNLYIDYLTTPASQIQVEVPQRKRKGPRGGVVIPFPIRLYDMLLGVQQADEGSLEGIVSWCSHGRSFRIHDPKAFVKEIMPR